MKNPNIGWRKDNSRSPLLNDSETRAIVTYIREQYYAGFPADKEMIMSKVEALLIQQDPPHYNCPSPTWTSNFLRNHLPSIKSSITKPIDIKRKAAQDIPAVEDFFRQYTACIREYNIPPERIWNFDEAGFRVGMPKGKRIYIPIEAPTQYSDSPKDRRQITLIEGISGVSKFIPLMIILKGKYFMENWVNPNQTRDKALALSATGYSNKKLGIKWLKHFIIHTGAKSTAEGGLPMLLLCDGHSSHTLIAFKNLAVSHNIFICKFLSHMTHVM